MHFNTENLCNTEIADENEKYVLINDDKKSKLACDMLMETTANSYNRLRDSFADFLQMPKKSIPSHYMAIKHHYQLDSGVISLSRKYVHLLSNADKAHLIVSNSQIDDYEGKKSKCKYNYFSKITGGYSKVHKIMTNQIKRCNDKASMDSIIMIDSFDGANHLETIEGKLDLVSFFSTLVNSNLLDTITDYSTAKSNCILTWMQCAAKEEPYMLLTVLEDHYKSKAQLKDKLKQKGSLINSYDIHDGKMIYNLLQCSQWNRKHHPFLLCKYKRGDVVKNYSTHKCNIMTDEDQWNLYERLANKFESTFCNDMSKNNISKHRDWADKSNFDITHFNIHPKLLLFSTIAFDNLHCRLSIVRSIWDFIHTYLEGYGFDMNKKFVYILAMNVIKVYLSCIENK